MKLGNKAIAVLLLGASLLLANFIASRLPVSIDTTADKLYTLSPGTKALLKKIEEPIRLEFYFSGSNEAIPVSYKNYATRVQETLRQYVRFSRGKLTLDVVDPRPDSPEEERASAAGITPQMLSNGDKVFFGLVVTQAEQQRVIPVFTAQREGFLEYDLSEAIHTVQLVTKRRLGLITSLPLQGAPQPPPMMARMRRPQSEGQFVASEWAKTFEIIPVEASATELPSGLDALAVIHPQGLSPKLEYAIDQFVLAGKPVILAVDPSSQHFKEMGGQNAMFGGPQPNVASDLPRLLKAYGVDYDSQQIVGDLRYAAQVQTQGGGIVRYPIWLNLQKGAFDAASLATAQLDSMLLVESGFLATRPMAGVTFTPLLQTSDQAGAIPAMSAAFAAPDAISREVKPSGVKALAVLVQGKLKSAFPDGAPSDEAKPEEAGKDAPPSPPPTSTSSLKESSATSTVLVIADTDWLLDRNSVQRMNFLGASSAEPFNDNLAFATNTLELLAGSEDLISLRGKGTSQRPFTVVQEMELAANAQYQEKLKALDDRLAEIQNKLTELQGKRGTNRLIASPEVKKAVEEFRKEQAATNAQRRAIRKALREDIESLGNRLLLINLFAAPLLVFAFGLWFSRQRRTV